MTISNCFLSDFLKIEFFIFNPGTKPLQAASVPFITKQPAMSCRDIHATNAFAFIIAFVSVGGIVVATFIPQWRITRLVTFNRNAKNISVYDGLWAKCVKQDGYSGCYYYDSEVLFFEFFLSFIC